MEGHLFVNIVELSLSSLSIDFVVVSLEVRIRPHELFKVLLVVKSFGWRDEGVNVRVDLGLATLQALGRASQPGASSFLFHWD